MRLVDDHASNLSVLDHALRYSELGLRVLDVPLGSKNPFTKGWQKLPNPSETEIRAWFAGRDRNLGIATGKDSNVWVLDIDVKTQDGEATLRTLLEEHSNSPIPETWESITGGGGRHLFFRIPIGITIGNDNSGKVGPGIDFKGNGGMVCSPPSIHPETKIKYAWKQGCAPWQRECAFAPDWLLALVLGETKPNNVTTISKARVKKQGLAELLEAAKGMGEGEGRNATLAAIVGHWIKAGLYPDAIRVMAETVNESFAKPLPSSEIDKMIPSLVSGDEARHGEERQGNALEDAAWLISGGNRIYTIPKIKSAEGYWVAGSAKPWANFDMKVIGRTDERPGISYKVTVTRYDNVTFDTLVTNEVLESTTKLDAFCAAYALTIPTQSRADSDNRSGSRNQRLANYLHSQNAPLLRIVDHLGWNDEFQCFVTVEGNITTAGLDSSSGVVPHPKLCNSNLVNYRYQMGDATEAREKLREVMTFQEETTAAVFASWWVACFLKGQLGSVTEIFPYMAVVAPAGYGKSNGYFDLMMKLAGSIPDGGMNLTTASTRDAIASHLNGPVWVDDPSDPDRYGDILRLATTGGSMVKKGRDNHAQESYHLVAPIFISAETLGDLLSERAHKERTILLTPPSAVNRTSLRNPKVSQYEDIVEFRAANKDLTKWSGTYVQEFLKLLPTYKATKLEPTQHQGRRKQAFDLLRRCARVLDDYLDSGIKWSQLVDEWCETSELIGNQNKLTDEFLPVVLSELTFIEASPLGGPAVYLQDECLRFNLPKVEATYRKTPKGKQIKDRDASLLGNLSDLAKQCGATYVGRVHIASGKRDNGKMARYWELTPETTQRVLDLAGLAFGEGV